MKRNNLEAFLSSRAGKRFFNIFYSWGASVVIIGALFKILHLPGANVALMIGMITEAIVFFISGFDTSDDVSANTRQNSSDSTSSVSILGDCVSPSNTGITTAGGKGQSQIKNSQSGGGVAGGTVIIGSLAGMSEGQQEGKNFLHSTTVKRENTSVASSTENSQPSVNNVSVEQGRLSQTAHDMSNLADVMGSLNEMSSSLLNTYKEINENSVDLSANSKSFVDNMKALNNNMLSLNSVYETQLSSIAEQMATVKYINESLDKIKKFYSDTLVDSSIFKDETEKMTKQIEALNQVYARLLRAMTSSSGNSMNNL